MARRLFSCVGPCGSRRIPYQKPRDGANKWTFLLALKVTHHGSSISSTPLFLNSFTPEIAVIQVGADSSYGHPTPQTLERLQKTGAQVFRNDEHGDVIVTIDGEKVDVAATKGG